jgi:hypothetical protein
LSRKPSSTRDAPSADYRHAAFVEKLPYRRHEDISHLRIVHLDHPDLIDRIDTDGQQSRLS